MATYSFYVLKWKKRKFAILCCATADIFVILTRYGNVLSVVPYQKLEIRNDLELMQPEPKSHPPNQSGK